MTPYPVDSVLKLNQVLVNPPMVGRDVPAIGRVVNVQNPTTDDDPAFTYVIEVLNSEPPMVCNVRHEDTELIA